MQATRQDVILQNVTEGVFEVHRLTDPELSSLFLYPRADVGAHPALHEDSAFGGPVGASLGRAHNADYSPYVCTCVRNTPMRPVQSGDESRPCPGRRGGGDARSRVILHGLRARRYEDDVSATRCRGVVREIVGDELRFLERDA